MADRAVNLETVIGMVNTYFRNVLNLNPDLLIDGIVSLPTVDAVPVRHGRWKHKKDLKQFFCDQCGEPSLTEDDVYFYGMEFPNFCPNCGADMRREGEKDG